jgi:hypothetical protein
LAVIVQRSIKERKRGGKEGNGREGGYLLKLSCASGREGKKSEKIERLVTITVYSNGRSEPPSRRSEVHFTGSLVEYSSHHVDVTACQSVGSQGLVEYIAVL